MNLSAFFLLLSNDTNRLHIAWDISIDIDDEFLLNVLVLEQEHVCMDVVVVERQWWINDESNTR